ncbi:hypothetical protein NliqN6_2573 [Naganishia liquefaciens]|uniref:Anaphase-promoting complex subunit 4-like WD40 domain-containing protein n=1 Tax=Naganishia liquefaciens TaxID=104408 RepID=A0A8H3YFX4_9TREE|nr:hypothetical protein NliqN6_2573 [Naganishia liquefaciens]
MHQSTTLATHHADLVTDVAYDYYGERLATASGDQKIKVWKKDPVKGSWDLEDEWKAHDAPVLQLAWSHPEHSNLLASCSYDRSVRIWEEVTVPHGAGGGAAGRPGGMPTAMTTTGTQQTMSMNTTPGKRWIECGLLMDARGSVRNLEFAPNAFGLKLATISTDSYLRIYACLSPSLDDWQLTNTVSLPSLQSSHNAKSATSDDTPHATGGVGAGLSLTGSASQSSVNAPNPGKGNEALGGWCLSWCKERWWGQVLAATSGHSGIIKLITLSTSTPSALLVLHPPPTPSTSVTSNGTPNSSTAAQGLGSQAITSLSWAPACGRSYHLIASGHRDGTVRVWKVVPPAASAEDGEQQRVKGQQQQSVWRGEVVAEWGKGDVTVGKVEWNMTGSILSVASEDGKVRLFKATYAGDWQLYGTFSAEAPVDEAQDGDDGGRMQE